MKRFLMIVMIMCSAVLGFAEKESFVKYTMNGNDGFGSPVEINFKYIVSDNEVTITNYSTSYRYRMTITIPSTIDGLPVTTIGERAFYSFFSKAYITGITIPDSVTTIGEGAFESCEDLESIAVSNTHPVYAFIDGVLFNKKEKSLHTYLMANRISNYTVPKGIITIGEGAFIGCKNLESITIPNSVTTIGEGAFESCNDLKSITIPDSVTTIGKSAFEGCEDLESIAVSNTHPVYAFIDGVLFNKKEKSLHTYLRTNKASSYTVPNSVITIGEGAFESCENLTLHVDDGSYLHKYAIENELSFEVIPDTSWLEE